MASSASAGELLVGSYLNVVGDCEAVSYNHRSEEMDAHREIDVLGFDSEGDVYIVETATHLKGLGYKDSVENCRKKFYHHEKYATEAFNDTVFHFQFWSPYVPEGKLTRGLTELTETFKDDTGWDLELVLNDKYTQRIEKLQTKAAGTTERSGEVGFRVLQVIEHLR
jgi:hypothetical protein